jgi:release factor glutamine methyltransferase
MAKKAHPTLSLSHLRRLLSHVTGFSLEYILGHGETLVDPTLFNEKAEELARGIPLSRILGHREFWGLNFRLSPATLDPRPDTETLIEAILKTFPDQKAPLKILDLGTGTGCIIISLLSEYRDAQGVAIDINPDALETAWENGIQNGVSERLQLLQGNWFNPLDPEDRFDIIVSNPPYISESDYKTLDKNVMDFDPIQALVGGEDGLECYRRIALGFKRHLNPSGALVLELGYGQEKGVLRMFSPQNKNEIKTFKDLSGIVRCIVIRTI